MGKDLSVPKARVAQVDVPALVMHGTASPPFMARTAETLSRPCHLEREPLEAAADWIETNRRIWAQRFDKLEAHLRDIQDAGHG